jgi:hypothetical protein
MPACGKRGRGEVRIGEPFTSHHLERCNAECLAFRFTTPATRYSPLGKQAVELRALARKLP